MDDDEYVVERPICCSVKTFLCTNYLWSVLSVGLLVLGVVGITVESGILVVLPPAAYFTAIAIGAYGIVVILMGVFGQKKSIELCFLLYILFVSLGLIAQTLAYCYLLLYANDVSTISSLDNAAINAQDAFENNLVRYAQDEPRKWEVTQDKLDCCGIDFEIGLQEPDKLNVFETGKKCDDPKLKAVVDSLRKQAEDEGFDVENDDVFLPAQDDDDIGAETGFFCKDQISLFMVANTPVIAAVLCFILIVQICALVSASRMYWVPEYLGGWQFDEEELEQVAKRKGLELPKQDYGPGVGGTFRATVDRLSFRFKNATTADPNIPEEAGFMKRISMMRSAPINPPLLDSTANGVNAGVVPFGQPNPLHAPNRGMSSGPPPGMFKRISQRISNKMQFGGATFSFPKQPSQPPPGIDQPMGAPPGINAGNSGKFSAPRSPQQPPGPPPMQKQQSRQIGQRAKRVSARLQAGLKSFGGAFSSGRGYGVPQGGQQSPQMPKPPEIPQSPSFAPPRTTGSNRSLGGASPNFPPPGIGARSNNRSNSNMRTSAPDIPPPVPPSKKSFGKGNSSRGGLPMPNAGFGSGTTTPSKRSFNESSDNLPPPPNFSYGGSNRSMGSANAMNGNNRSQGFGNPRPSGGGFKLSMGGKGGKKKKSKKGRPSKAPANVPAPTNERSGLLAQIQMGKALKKTVTNDRSAPII